MDRPDQRGHNTRAVSFAVAVEPRAVARRAFSLGSVPDNILFLQLDGSLLVYGAEFPGREGKLVIKRLGPKSPEPPLEADQSCDVHHLQ